jgi:hypothetical protein
MVLKYTMSDDQSLKKDMYKWAHKKNIIIFGNGEGINNITSDNYNYLDKYKNEIFTIGLKRMYLKYNTDIILYADDYINKEYLRNYDMFKDKSKLIRLSKEFAQIHLISWKRNHSFKDIKRFGIWHHRNVLIGALHTCWLLNIKNIILSGIDMDSRKYFFGIHPRYKNSKQKYEPHTVMNYNVYDLTRQVLVFLLSNGFKITYTDKSKFLSTIPGIKKVNWETIDSNIIRDRTKVEVEAKAKVESESESESDADAEEN